MEQSASTQTIVKKRRYYLLYADSTLKWHILYGKNNLRCLFNEEQAARDYMHKVLDNIEGCTGVQIRYEDYYVQA